MMWLAASDDGRDMDLEGEAVLPMTPDARMRRCRAYAHLHYSKLWPHGRRRTPGRV